MKKVKELYFAICDMIKGNHLSKNFNFYFLTPLSQNFKMLHFDASPITIGYLVTELWSIWQCQKQYKTKEFEHCFCQYFKNNIADIRLIPLDHVTYDENSRWVVSQIWIFVMIHQSINNFYSSRHVSDRRPFLNIQGEWTGIMTGKAPDEVMSSWRVI